MASHLQTANDIHEVFMNFGRKQARLFEQDNISYTEALLRLTGSRKMMVWLYYRLRNYKYITPIEDLSQEEKEQMWQFTKEICVGEHRVKEKMRQMSLSFYALEYFLNEQENKTGSI